MAGPDRPLFNLEITEDSKEGISIRLAHAGRRPDVLAGIPKEVLRRARPWIWNSYERRVLKRAKGMSTEAYRIVRDTLLLERVRMVMASRPQAKGPARLSWLERRRLQRAHTARVKDMAQTEQVTRHVAVSETAPQPERSPHRPTEPILDRATDNPAPQNEPTLTERMRALSGTALSEPKILPSRDRSR